MATPLADRLRARPGMAGTRGPLRSERGENLAELLARQAQLEDAAGVRKRVDEVRTRPDLGLFGYDLARQRIRRSYFAVADPPLRLRLIQLASDIERRSRSDARAELRRARTALQRARRTLAEPAWPSAAIVALLTVVAGGIAFGSAGEAMAAPVGLLGAIGFARLRREHARRAEAEAARDADRAEASLNARASLPRLFDPGEAASGVENVEYGRLSAVSLRACAWAASARAVRPGAQQPPSPTRT